MTNREMATQYRMTEWAEIIRERVASGQSIENFCADRNIAKSRYFYWQKKLRAAACEHIESQQNCETGLSVPGFLEVNLESTPKPTASGQLSMEIDGVRISADGTY